MFCPTCGKNNQLELRFCASCGTNLEAVSMALTGREEDFFTKIDTGMDQFIARYTEHVFKNAASDASEHKVAKSWRLLGQAVLTSVIDVLLFMLMWNVLPLRFLLLLISTPFRLLAERSKQENRDDRPSIEDYQAPQLPGPMPRLTLNESVPSVTENTTFNLAAAKKKAAPTTDKLK